MYSHNIRYGTEHIGPGELPWKDRRDLVVASIWFNARNNAIVGLQEVLSNQLEDILARLGPNWKHVGVGRNESNPHQNEFSPILFDTTVWELVDWKTYWLSETPDVPSRGWDADLFRIVTWARLKNIASSQVVDVMSTHFDHMGDISRQESANLIINLVEKLGNNPTAVMGDFNMTEAHPGYKILADAFTDSGALFGEEKCYGHWRTYTGFQEKDDHNRIDYIWSVRRFKVQTYGVLHSEFKGIRFSDHRPIAADLLVQ